MRKVLSITAGTLLALVVLLVGLEMLAAESAEVVVLRVPQGEQAQEVRLWVVDVDGTQYLRAGHEGASWYGPLQAAAQVEVERAGVSGAYRAVPAPQLRDRVNGEFLAKYGWRDRYIGLLVGGRDHALPIRLEPVD